MSIRERLEKWKPIEGWPKYEISNLGNVKRLASFDTTGRWYKERVVKPKQDGYATLSDKPNRRLDISIARLVLLTFIGPPPSAEKNQARHLDDDRYNNWLGNLAWGSSWDNHQDRIRNGGTRRGIPRPDWVREKIGAAQRGKPRNPASIKKMAETKRGSTLTKEHKEKIRQSMLRRFQCRSGLSEKL